MCLSRTEVISILALVLSLLQLTLAKSVNSKKEKIIKSTENTKEKELYPPEHCWKHETFITQTECLQCKPSEKTDVSACGKTGNRQLVICEKSKTRTYISCPFVGAVENKRFWTFEAVSFACAFLSNAVVWWRRRSLQYLHYQRVKRQMSDGSV